MEGGERSSGAGAEGVVKVEGDEDQIRPIPVVAESSCRWKRDGAAVKVVSEPGRRATCGAETVVGDYCALYKLRCSEVWTLGAVVTVLTARKVRGG